MAIETALEGRLKLVASHFSQENTTILNSCCIVVNQKMKQT